VKETTKPEGAGFRRRPPKKKDEKEPPNLSPSVMGERSAPRLNSETSLKKTHRGPGEKSVLVTLSLKLWAVGEAEMEKTCRRGIDWGGGREK